MSEQPLVVPSALSCPRLIERDAELQTLLKLAAMAAGENPEIAIVTGDAGIGKSRLLDELRAALAPRAAVAVVACPSFAPVALGPIYALLETLAPNSAPEPVGEPEPDARDSGQLQLFSALLERLRTAAKLRPIVAIVDDAHWADSATFEFLRFAARSLNRERLLIVIAYRPESNAGSADLERAVAAISRLSRTGHVKLRALTHEGVARFVDATLGDSAHPSAAAQRRVREHSAGNPLFALELLKSALERDASAVLSLQALVGERAATMADGDRRLLETAALIGRRFSAAFLEKLTGAASRSSVSQFLRDAVERNFLIEDREVMGSYDLRHALVRDAILASVLPLEARDMHLAIGRALEEEPDAASRVAELSEHFWQAGAKSDCAPYARLAGERSMACCAYREAAQHFERALTCAASEAGEAALHEQAAAAYYELGDIADAGRHQGIAVDLARAGNDRAALVHSLTGLATFKQRIDDVPATRASLDEAATLEREVPDDRLRVRILAQRAALSAHERAWADVEAALAEVDRLPYVAEPRDMALLHGARSGLLFFHRRDYEGGIAESDAATSSARETGRPASIIDRMTGYACLLGRVRPTGQTIAACTQAVRFAEGYRDRFQTMTALAAFAEASVDAGRLDDAHGPLRLMRDETNLPPVSLMATGRLAARLAARLAVYEPDDALRPHAGIADALARTTERNVDTWYGLAVAVADLHAANGKGNAARETLALFLGRAEFANDESLGSRALPAVGAYGASAQVEIAFAVAAAWRRFDNPHVRANVALFDAYVAARFRSPHDAMPYATYAASAFAALEMPLLEAEAHVLAGNLPRAIALMQRTGARRLARRIDR